MSSLSSRLKVNSRNFDTKVDYRRAVDFEAFSFGIKKDSRNLDAFTWGDQLAGFAIKVDSRYSDAEVKAS